MKEYFVAAMRPLSTIMPAITVAMFLIKGPYAVLFIVAYYIVTVKTRLNSISGVLNAILWIVGLILCIINLPRSGVWLAIYIALFLLLFITGKKYGDKK